MVYNRVFSDTLPASQYFGPLIPAPGINDFYSWNSYHGLVYKILPFLPADLVKDFTFKINDLVLGSDYFLLLAGDESKTEILKTDLNATITDTPTAFTVCKSDNTCTSWWCSIKCWIYLHPCRY